MKYRPVLTYVRKILFAVYPGLAGTYQTGAYTAAMRSSKET